MTSAFPDRGLMPALVPLPRCRVKPSMSGRGLLRVCCDSSSVLKLLVSVLFPTDCRFLRGGLDCTPCHPAPSKVPAPQVWSAFVVLCCGALDQERVLGESGPVAPKCPSEDVRSQSPRSVFRNTDSIGRSIETKWIRGGRGLGCRLGGECPLMGTGVICGLEDACTSQASRTPVKTRGSGCLGRQPCSEQVPYLLIQHDRATLRGCV